MFVYKRGKLIAFIITLDEEDIQYQLSACHHPQNALTRPIFTDSRKERVQFDKITARVSRLCYGLDPEHVDAAAITQKVISGVYQGVTTIELDNLVCSLSRTA